MSDTKQDKHGRTIVDSALPARLVKLGDHVENLAGPVTRIWERGGMLVLEAGSEDNSTMLYPSALVRIVVAG